MADNSDDVTALENFIKSTVVDFVNTSIECEIVSYENGRATVKPINQKTYDDGDSNDYPTLQGLRMLWPQFDGGKAGVKGPVKPGDNCLLIVCQHAMDDSGDNRKYSLIDSYVIPGAGYDDSIAGNDDMRIYYGEAFLAIGADKKIKINAPGGFEVVAPQSNFSNAVTVKGLFTYQAGATGSGGSGGVMNLTGNLNVNGEVTVNGIKLSTHRHPETGSITNGPTN